MSDIETSFTNCNLELGDIIKIHSPSNEQLNDKSFIISFINDTMIDLNSSDLNTTLHLDEGKLTDESIVKITILYKNKLFVNDFHICKCIVLMICSMYMNLRKRNILSITRDL